MAEAPCFATDAIFDAADLTFPTIFFAALTTFLRAFEKIDIVIIR